MTYPFVFRFDGEGRVLETLQASASSGLPSFSSVVQSGDELLLGSPGGLARSMRTAFIGYACSCARGIRLACADDRLMTRKGPPQAALDNFSRR